MSESSEDRVHVATPQRRRAAYEQGRRVRSQDLASAAILLAGLASLLYLGGNLAQALATSLHDRLSGQPWLTLDSARLAEQCQALTQVLAATLLPILGLLMAWGVLGNLLQTGIVFLPQKAAPDWGRVNPAGGMGRIFCWSNAVRSVFGLLKLVIVAAVAGHSMYAAREAIGGSGALDAAQLATFISHTATMIALKAAGALLVLGLADYGFQWWQHEREMKMTTQEVRDEMRAMQGDPQVAARRRQMRSSPPEPVRPV
ncbi:MAG: EscU/YscU/HrcU family type III secretion system export apparatus switch protein [Planctomycetia bacterium]|nr:EscU/YscU/HrcU family type III secretion system export apparatus switch protein [Planctomycetia bacterium]